MPARLRAASAALRRLVPLAVPLAPSGCGFAVAGIAVLVLDGNIGWLARPPDCARARARVGLTDAVGPEEPD